MRASIITLTGHGSVLAPLVIPAGNYGFYLCPTVENSAGDVYRGDFGVMPVRVESPTGGWEPLQLQTAGGIESAVPLPALHIVRDYGNGQIFGTWFLVIYERPGERYQPPITPRLGTLEPRFILFSSDSAESSSPLHVTSQVRRVTLMLAAAGTAYEGGDGAVGPTDDVEIYVKLYSGHIPEEDSYALIATVPSTTRFYSFEPPLPGDYYLRHASASTAVVGAVATLLVEVGA